MENDPLVQLYFFPDEKTKYDITGHRGAGWGFGDTIVEVYNDSTQLDPFHELVHVLGYKSGHPPAMLDEGLAVHLSEELGSDAFAGFIGYPGQTLDEVFKVLIRSDRLISIQQLFNYKEIAEAPDVVLAYVQSASFVKFLLKTGGRERFLDLFAGSGPNAIEANEALFEQIYEMSLLEAEKKWMRWLSF
ncbi:MAG: hypothetical protein DWQ10_02080 [Calditrichaeota bacterium]|nr:MAG: hypothetical protein DWQ10_02080 [Calditrichota bacterium]